MLKHPLEADVVVIFARTWPSLIEKISLIFMIIYLNFSSLILCKCLATHYTHAAFWRHIICHIFVISGTWSCSIIVVLLKETKLLGNYSPSLVISA